MAAELSGFLNRHHQLASVFLPGMVQSPRPPELPTCARHMICFSENQVDISGAAFERWMELVSCQ